jgi:outer membrane protein TolC
MIPPEATFYRSVLAVLALAVPLYPGNAAEDAPTREADPDLRLKEAITASLASNFAYRIAGLNPSIARQAVTEAEARFDPEIFAQGSLSQSIQETTFTATTGTSSDNRSWLAGVRKRFAYGTAVSAQTNLSRRDSNAGVNTSNLSQTADLSLSVRQPLLRGFGPEANLAEVERAGAGYEASREALRGTLLDVLAETERAYWNVARLQEQLELNQSSLEVADSLLEEARERRRVGIATEVEVLQAEAARARQREDIIETRRLLGDAIDSLLSFMGLVQTSGTPSLDEQPMVQSLADVGGPIPDFTRVWNQAQVEDPVLSRQEFLINQQEWQTRSARTELRPNLDLVLSGAYIGLDDADADIAYENALDGKGHAWSVGVEFSMPWRLRGERASLLASEQRLEQEELRYLELKQSLFRQVRSTWRTLESLEQSLEAARLTVSLQEATFQQEKGKYEEGISVFRDVLEVQRDLDQARIRLLQAKYNRLSSEIDIARLTGSLFERHGLNREDLIPE